MKVVIQTQVRENYGDADKPYWKFKGGNVYVVPNLTVSQAARVKEDGIPTLTALIETRNSGFEEYILGFNIVEDNAVTGEPWETPTNLFWEYDMLMGGDRENYTAKYLMRDGREFTYAELEQFFKEVA